MGHFAGALVRIRLAAGFPTAYAFYHRGGGRKAFPFSYAYYTQIERGKTLPRAEWLPVILALLRLPPDPEARRELLLDYLRDTVGRDEVFEDLFRPLVSPSEARAAEPRALRRLIGRNAHPLSTAQMRAMLKTPASYWSFVVLTSSRGSVEAEDSARRCGLKTGEIERALVLLGKAKLASARPGGRWASPFGDAFVVIPRNYAGYAQDRARLADYWEKMTESRGGDLLDLGSVLRIPTPVALQAVALLRQAVETATAQYEDEEISDAPFFLLQTRVRRLLPA